MDGKVASFIVLLGGVFFLYFGIACRIGQYRSWYFVSDKRSLIPYVGIPWGIGIFSVIFSRLLPTEEMSLAGVAIGGGGGFLLGFLFSIFQPAFMKPAWLKWLEKQQLRGSRLMFFVRKEFRAIGEQEWERRTSTQQDFEMWLDEVRQKHGFIRVATPK